MQKGNTCRAGLYFHLLPTQGYTWESFTAAGGRDVLPRNRPQPLPPSSTAKIQAGCPAYGGSDGAVEGCRGRRVGIKTSVRRPGRRQPLMVLTELLWSVVWKICILRRARGGRGTADRGGT